MAHHIHAPFPFPDLWPKVAENGGHLWGAQWLAPPLSNLTASPTSESHRYGATIHAYQRDSNDHEDTEGGETEELSLDLDGEGEIILTEEWRSRLVFAAQRRQVRDQSNAEGTEKPGKKTAGQNTREKKRNLQKKKVSKAGEPTPYLRFQLNTYGKEQTQYFQILEAALDANIRAKKLSLLNQGC